MAASTKKTSAAPADGRVKVTLAHPINSARDKAYLGWPEDTIVHPGDEVEVPQSAVTSLIAAGIITVDPEDADAVAEITGQPAPAKQDVITP